MGGVCVRCIYTPAESVQPESRLDGLVALVTGVTRGGIGYDMARSMARRGAHVILAGRDARRLREARDVMLTELERDALPSTPQLTTLQLDVSDLASVDQCVSSFAALGLPLNLLMHNAGVLCPNGGRHDVSAQGIELSMATNYLGAFYLTQRLLPSLLRGSMAQRQQHGDRAYISRVIHISSTAHQYSSLPTHLSRIDSFFRPQPAFYDSWDSYAHSKLCQLLHAAELSRRYDPLTQLQSFSCHPGLVHTSIGDTWYLRLTCCLLAPCFKTVPQGAATGVFLACAPSRQLAEHSGAYFDNLQPARVEARVRDPDVAAAVWDHTQEVIKQWQADRSVASAASLDTNERVLTVTVSRQSHDDSLECDHLLLTSAAQSSSSSAAVAPDEDEPQ
jgi:retinol dehydrogenase-12